MQKDMTYIDMGLYTAFYPETQEGIRAWNEMAEYTAGTGKVLTLHKDQLIYQLRQAGYKVAKG